MDSSIALYLMVLTGTNTQHKNAHKIHRQTVTLQVYIENSTSYSYFVKFHVSLLSQNIIFQAINRNREIHSTEISSIIFHDVNLSLQKNPFSLDFTVMEA